MQQETLVTQCYAQIVGMTMQQETLVTQCYAQIVGLPEGHCHKAF